MLRHCSEQLQIGNRLLRLSYQKCIPVLISVRATMLATTLPGLFGPAAWEISVQRLQGTTRLGGRSRAAPEGDAAVGAVWTEAGPTTQGAIKAGRRDSSGPCEGRWGGGRTRGAAKAQDADLANFQAGEGARKQSDRL